MKTGAEAAFEAVEHRTGAPTQSCAESGGRGGLTPARAQRTIGAAAWAMQAICATVMPILTANNLHKAYGARPVLDGADIFVQRGEKIGLVGKNGAGKSTLLRGLAGLEAFDQGVVALRSGSHVAVVAQNPELGDAKTLLDVALQGTRQCREPLEPYEALLRAEQALKSLGVSDPHLSVQLASGGTQRRAALAAALLQEPDLLFLDEPTNHLDAETVQWLETAVAAMAGAVVLVTHDRWFLNQVVDRIIELRAGGLRSYPGTFQDYLDARLQEDVVADKLESRRRNLLRIELDWLGRSPAARSTKPKARIQTAQALVNAARDDEKPLRLPQFAVERLGKTVLEARSLAVGFGTRTLVRDLDMTLVRGDRLGLVGPNGAGKTTLLRTLMGELPPLNGTVKLGQHTHVLAIDQKRTGLDPTLTVQAAASLTGTDWVQLGEQRIHVAGYLEPFLFRREDLLQPVHTLSGGQKFRLLLARRLQEPMNLLVLDEPTNDLDLETLQVLEQALSEYAGCALVVSHDRAFLDRVCTGILHVVGDSTARWHSGNYTQFLQNQAAARRNQPVAVAKAAPVKGKPSGKLTWAEDKRLGSIEGEIEQAESRAALAEAQMAEPAMAADFSQLQVVMAEHAAATALAAQLWAEWERLEGKRGLGE